MSAPAADVLAEAISGLRPAALDQVIAMADLQTRMDRKYLVPAPIFDTFMQRMDGRLSALEIDDRRLFHYESVYFDTPDLTAYHQHAHGRRHRFKVRTRSYLDSAACVLEVKTQGGRGETVKDRHPYRFADRHQLTSEGMAFAAERLTDATAVPSLRAVITTAYRRSTLVDLGSGSRLTADVDLSFADGASRRSGPADMLLVESKTAGTAATADALLWRLGCRPVSLSKYCVGMALMRPSLPANQWNRELRRHFGWTPCS